MKLRTSCFNRAIFRKDMTRFAPIGVLYTLCLIAGLMLMSGDDNAYPFWFANSMTVCIRYMSVINLVYGALMAALLFGDLYNGRMCNGLHAMPLRRQELFATHILSGLTYSLVPTAVMALISLPLLCRTIVENAWQLGLYWWLASNLQFVCFFGMAVFAAFCAGNWLGMGAVYAGLQFGSMLVYSLVDAFYTPMLSGVETSEWLATNLCPMCTMTLDMVELDSYELLRRRFFGREEEMVATFTLTEHWTGLLLWAVVGVAFLGIAWLLYRRRDLESAGDPIAVKALVPVVQVFGALALGGIAAMVFREMLSGSSNVILGYVVLFAAIAVAWFAVRMVLQRTSRVFQKKAFLALIPVLGVVAVTLGLTKLDVLGIASWLPDEKDVKSVTISYRSGDFTEEADIRAIIRLHELAMGEDIPQSGRYDKSLLAQGLPLQEVYRLTCETEYTDEQVYLEDTFRRAATMYFYYDMGYGRTVTRHYVLWLDGESANIMDSLCQDWDGYWNTNSYGNLAGEFPVEPEMLDTLYIQGYPGNNYQSITPEEVTSLLAALKKDYEAGNLNTDSYARKGAFRYAHTDELTGEVTYTYDYDLYMDLRDSNAEEWSMGVSLNITPSSKNTIAWLREHGNPTWEVILPEE